MTATRSHVCRTTAMLCAMSRMLSPSFSPQLLEQVQHRRLHRDVERRDGLVGDEQLRLEREGARDAHALALTAGELARIGVERPRAEPDEVEQLAAARVDAAPRGRSRARAGARGASAARSCAGSATSTGPGRPSGSAAASLDPACAGRAARRGSASPPRSGRRGRRCSGRASTCRSPDSPTSPTVSPVAHLEVDAVDGPQHGRGRRRSRRPSSPRSGKCIASPRTLEQRLSHRRSPGRGATSAAHASSWMHAVARLGSERAQRKLAAHAIGLCERAAGMEAAPRAAARRGRAASPGIVESVSRTTSTSRHGAEQAERVGVVRLSEDRLDGPVLDDLARVHHRDVLARLRDHREVVRDEDDAHAELLAAATRAGSGSDPGSSRRARSSARRRGGASGRPRARSRSSRAGAARPRARTGRRPPGARGRGCPRGASARALAARAARRPSPSRTSGPSAI